MSETIRVSVTKPKKNLLIDVTVFHGFWFFHIFLIGKDGKIEKFDKDVCTQFFAKFRIGIWKFAENEKPEGFETEIKEFFWEKGIEIDNVSISLEVEKYVIGDEA